MLAFELSERTGKRLQVIPPMAITEDREKRKRTSTGDVLSLVAILEWAILCYAGAVILCSTSSRFGDPSLDVLRNGVSVGAMLAFCSSPMAVCMVIVRGSVGRLLLLGLGVSAVCVTASVDTTCVAPLIVSVLFARFMFGRGAGARF
ncbi:MAG: hypothetical protein U1F60_07125 [Planctomycetota bacterium]